MFPTFLGISGADSVDSDGVDLAPLWLRGEAVPKRDLFWRTRSHRAVRSGPWKLIAPLREDAKPELYHLGNDPAESQSKDLAGNAPETVERLLKAWSAWQADVVKSAKTAFKPRKSENHLSVPFRKETAPTSTSNRPTALSSRDSGHAHRGHLGDFRSQLRTFCHEAVSTTQFLRPDGYSVRANYLVRDQCRLALIRPSACHVNPLRCPLISGYLGEDGMG